MVRRRERRREEKLVARRLEHGEKERKEEGRKVNGENV